MKLLIDVARTNEPPGCFIMVDEEETCIAVAIYHLDSEVYTKMTDKDVFYILDPFLKKVELNQPTLVSNIWLLDGCISIYWS